MPPPSTETDTNRLAAIILGEAANQGPEGMAAVLDTLVNRSRRSGRTLEEEATRSALNKKGVRVYQFTAAGRPDLEEFAARQPYVLRRLVDELIAERQQPDFVPSHPYRNYVTREFYDKRGELPSDHWVRQMRAATQIGDHVFLEEVPRRK